MSGSIFGKPFVSSNGVIANHSPMRSGPSNAAPSTLSVANSGSISRLAHLLDRVMTHTARAKRCGPAKPWWLKSRAAHARELNCWETHHGFAIAIVAEAALPSRLKLLIYLTFA